MRLNGLIFERDWKWKWPWSIRFVTRVNVLNMALAKKKRNERMKKKPFQHMCDRQQMMELNARGHWISIKSNKFFEWFDHTKQHTTSFVRMTGKCMRALTVLLFFFFLLTHFYARFRLSFLHHFSVNHKNME